MVNVTPRPLYSQERTGTHFIGGWVGPRSGLDRCEKSRPPPGYDEWTVTVTFGGLYRQPDKNTTISTQGIKVL